MSSALHGGAGASPGTAEPAGLFSRLAPLPPRPDLRQAITRACRRSEQAAVADVLKAARLSPQMVERSQALARRLAAGLRAGKEGVGKSGLVQALLQEFSLSSQEGVALMCLAEALLRVPDAATRDALIRDKLRDGNWAEHAGRASSLYINAAAWGLALTGQLVATHSESGMNAALKRLLAKGGEPLVRKGMDVAMRMLGEQFVAGQTIEEALRHAGRREAQGFRHSYDMLGEAALTSQDAQRYLADYERAIHAIGTAAAGLGVYEGPGISIKLSALHPRYSRAQFDRVMSELYPKLLGLARLACRYDIGLNIDAEEADRLELSLDLFERLCFEQTLQGWEGLGCVAQAYQKRCPYLIDYLVDLARRGGRRIMVRLVKGAYWDTEIKRAQLDGLEDYPVYTRKAYTDVSYIACARRLLAAGEWVYPQFATHNAHTLAVIYELAGSAGHHAYPYEFQCLYGMGESLYAQVAGTAAGNLGIPCRIYAPVGSHDTLLAYLVRRLLENGANTSFVNQAADPSIPMDVLVDDPVRQVEAMAAQEGGLGAPHPGIPLPLHLYGTVRDNSRGLDLADELVLGRLASQLQDFACIPLAAAPLLADEMPCAQPDGEWAPVPNPAQHADIVGRLRMATPQEVELALQAAADFAPQWAACPPAERAAALTHAATQLEGEMERFMGILVREAGKTYANAIAEVREAVDFLRYYAAQVKAGFHNATYLPLGVVTCISPWNFPLAIFLGQAAAALAAGNVVLAKPAEQTTLVAFEAVRLLWAAGVPRAALQLLPGRGEEIGPLLVDDERVQGVMFTGSTRVARELQKRLANRLGPGGRSIPLVAETGGQNAMIVDSSALAEQVVRDVLSSAFDSAGQRCSALRVLCVQEEVADSLLVMLKGAMQELRVGEPMQLHHDVGPVIDARARDAVNRHIAEMVAKGCRVHQLCWGDESAWRAVMGGGTYVLPTLIEIESMSELTAEVFGPVLHFLRYRREQLDDLLAQIAATGYGLTMGLHTRIEETIKHVADRARVGNLYVNRNMVGAVVGVQPFGGEGLSGTGPKAGGPLYLYRLLASRPDEALAVPFGAVSQEPSEQPLPVQAVVALEALNDWHGLPQSHRAGAGRFFGPSAWRLPGPTGERNLYRVVPRAAVLCLAEDATQLITQLEAVLAVGSHAIWDANDQAAVELYHRLPAVVQARITLSAQWEGEAFDAALHHGGRSSASQVSGRLAGRSGMIVPLTALGPAGTAVPLERLVVERALSIDTTAAGGNASLMTMG